MMPATRPTPELDRTPIHTPATSVGASPFGTAHRRARAAATVGLLAAILALCACGSRDRDASEAELAKRIEAGIPAGPDRSDADRRAAAEALAHDALELAKDAAAVAPTAAQAIEQDAARDAAVARECEQLAAEIEILKRRLADPAAAGDRLGDEERAVLPADLARHEARYTGSCR